MAKSCRADLQSLFFPPGFLLVVVLFIRLGVWGSQDVRGREVAS